MEKVQVGLLKLVAGLERLVKDGAGEQITYLQADQSLAATGGRSVDLHVKTVEGRAIQFEKHFALDVNGIDQCSHGSLRGLLNVDQRTLLGYQAEIFFLNPAKWNYICGWAFLNRQSRRLGGQSCKALL